MIIPDPKRAGISKYLVTLSSIESVLTRKNHDYVRLREHDIKLNRIYYSYVLHGDYDHEEQGVPAFVVEMVPYNSHIGVAMFYIGFGKFNSGRTMFRYQDVAVKENLLELVANPTMNLTIPLPEINFEPESSLPQLEEVLEEIEAKLEEE